MSRNLRIGGAAGTEGGLRFTELAAKKSNVKGNISFHEVVYYDDFDGKAIDNTNDYTVAAIAEGAATVVVPHMCRLATATNDNDDIDMAMGIEWYGQYNATLEARFRINDVDMTGTNIGFSDATGEAADLIAMMLTTGSLVSTAADFVGFAHDADATTDNLYAVSVKGNNDGAIINSGSLPTDGKYYTVRVELVDNGTTCDAKFYVNTSGKAIDPYNDYIGEELDAVTRTTALCPYIAHINHGEAAANTLDIDYLKLWQDRS